MKSVIIDEDVHRLLRIVAAETNKSIKHIVNDAILYIIEKNNKQIPNSLKLFYQSYEHKNINR